MTAKRKPKRDQMVTVKEAADHLGVAYSSVRSWRQRYDSFPDPAFMAGPSAVFEWGDVSDWHKAHSKRLDAKTAK